MHQELLVSCPHCFEEVSLWIAIDDVGEQYCDCSVCCHPWHMWVWLDEEGIIRATVSAAY